ncbi:MAG: trypsin-like serine protease [Kofleriaceae bacterium]
MRRTLLVAWLLVPVAAAAAPGGAPPPPPAVTPAATPVIGGENVPAGMWRDVAAVLFGGQQGCTGTLVTPTLVLTADHCRDPQLDAVLIGTNSLARPGDGERIRVIEQLAGPGAFDVALLVLERPSTIAPRLLATGWAQSQIVDGAAVELVGYGAVDRNATQFVDELQQAASTVTDAGCTTSAGCDSANRPDGEIGAGGGGIDTCPGDSGGPMFLVLPEGAFLAGVTSRGYDSNQFDCSEGGIYTRPDKAELVAWIEAAAGDLLEDGLHPHAEAMAIPLGGRAHQTLAAADPYGTNHRWEIVVAPATGEATISADGTLTITAPDAVGEASVVVRAIDTDHPTRSARVRVALAYRDDLDDGGCCSTSGGGGASALALASVVAALITRRRRS